MKNDTEKKRVEPTVRFSVKILPFGILKYEIPATPVLAEPKESEPPIYTEPLTTYTGAVEVKYEEGEAYITPLKTA
jgi:hypothetical protein